MLDLSQLFMRTDSSATSIGTVLFAMLLTLTLTMVLAGVYTWTFRGMSYTRSYVHALVLVGLVAAMIMLAVNYNIAAGLGIMGSLAIVRFRTSMRDPRDMVFVFAAMAAGIAAGIGVYAVAILGTLIFCISNVMATVFEIGARHSYDGLLRFRAPVDPSIEAKVAKLIRKHTRRFAMVTLREIRQGEAMEHAYQVSLRKNEDKVSLMADLKALPNIKDVTMHFQDHTVEI